MNKVLLLLDELEKMVEKGADFMGQRMVNEEAFFMQMQRVRDAPTPRVETAVTSKKLEDFIAESRLLTSEEQLQIVAVMANCLAMHHATASHAWAETKAELSDTKLD